MGKEIIMLSLKEFTEELITDCKTVLRAEPGDQIEIEKGTVTKPQKGALTGLRFIKPGSRVAPTLYAEDMYERYTQGYPIDSIAREAVESIMKSFDIPLPLPEDEFDLKDMTADIRPRLISKERNPIIAEMAPHMEVCEGLMLIADVVRGDFRAMITNELIKDSGIADDELFDIALGNIPDDEAVMFGLSDMIYATAGERTELLGSDTDSSAIDDFEVFILSNREMFWGAAALLYPGVMDKLHKMLGDFYVIPSSVHELLLLPITADADPKNISQMIWSANRSVVNEEEVLSDDLYIYDSDKLRIAVPGSPATGTGPSDPLPC